MLNATLTAHGPRALLRALRKRVIDGLREEAPETRVSEHHHETAGHADHGPDAGGAEDQPAQYHLEFRLQAPGGVPFPPLVAASAEYPDCVLSITWEGAQGRGQTTLRAGHVQEVEQDGATHGGPPCAIRVDAQGRLLLALALDIDAAGTLGFCATAEAETFFRLRGVPAAPELYTIGGESLAWDEVWRRDGDDYLGEALFPEQPLTPAERHTLDYLATRLRADWLWYAHQPLEETIVERARFAEAGRAVGTINVKSRPLAGLDGRREQALPDAGAAWIVELLADTWA